MIGKIDQATFDGRDFAYVFLFHTEHVPIGAYRQ
jgi:hypothetical protein